MTVRHTLTGARRYYFTRNGVTWWEVTARQATYAVEKGATLLLT